ncbi:MAG: AraC family transcriptional regulator [Ectothiorhodospiraceae bacterium]|nr:AraC family transcriptional regulator [Ectothiorhodospiraceae bacterium]
MVLTKFATQVTSGAANGVRLALFLVLMLAAVGAGAEVPPSDLRSLDEETQALKREIIELNRDLFVLEEELLFPANTQIAVFVSTDVGELFSLDSVRLQINGTVVANHLYTPREIEALRRGGIHGLYIGNLRTGEHLLEAVFTGKGPAGRDYRRGAHLTVNKGLGARFVELRIDDSTRKQQPEFVIREWE